MRLVGLTGGIATGKSTVARTLREAHGLPVVDADQVAREVVAPGTPGHAAVLAAFGPEAAQADGAVDRSWLRAQVMADPEARRRLEAITHPAIRQGILDRLLALQQAGETWAVVEAALLVETGSYRMYPELIVVSCDPELQVRRVMARDGVSEPAARAVIAAQLPLSDKERVATEVVRNDGSLDALRAEVAAAWERIRRRAADQSECPAR